MPSEVDMDNLTTDQRRVNMSRVKSKDTTPELAVRQTAHAMGLRFRLHRRDLIGTPDLVFPKHRVAIFVHGCFWHRHPGCKRATTPRTNVPFWLEKFQTNVTRDQRAQDILRADGWHVDVVWECETRDDASLQEHLRRIFGTEEHYSKETADERGFRH